MKPCNESEIVGLTTFKPSEEYLKGYEAAEKNNLAVLKKIRREIEKQSIADFIAVSTVADIIDCYIQKGGKE